MAEGLKLKNNPAHVVVYTGDGELQEGSCWEAFMQAAHRKLDNIIAIIDRNRLQIDGCTENVMSLDNLSDKLRAFNWDVIEINGHDFNEIYTAVETAKNVHALVQLLPTQLRAKDAHLWKIKQAGMAKLRMMNSFSRHLLN